MADTLKDVKTPIEAHSSSRGDGAILTIDQESLDIQITGDDLPVFSTVVTRALRLIEGGDATAKNLEDLIRLDPSLTSRILRLANSVLYGARIQINSINQAVIRLGMSELKNTILIAGVGEVFDKNDEYLSLFWNHAVAVALASHMLSDVLGIGIADECFVSGMLHDIGKVIIYRQEPKFYSQLIEEANEGKLRFYSHERTRINFCSHETVGALVGRRWRLSSDTTQVIRFHHDVEEDEEIAKRADRVILLISLANIIATKLGHGAEDGSDIHPVETYPAQHLGLDADAIEKFSEKILKIIEEQQSDFI